MNIGALNLRATIQRPSTTQDSRYGTRTPSYTNVRTAWVALQDALPSRAEVVTNELKQATNPTRVRMRYCTDVDATMRLVVSRMGVDVIYQLVSGPAILGNKEGLEFMAERYSTEATA